MDEFIELDGNYGEGGGSLVRVALALSALTQKPFKATDIRKGRSYPGLKNQHLYGIKALKVLCNAKTEGDFLGSTSLEFVPGKLSARDMSIDIETAGSITLILQSLMLPLMSADKKSVLTIKGGTDTKWSPQFDYMSNVFLPQVSRFADVKAELKRRGYYPKGNGKIDVSVSPKLKLEGIKEGTGGLDLSEQGNLIKVHGISHASDQLKNASVAERQVDSAKEILHKHLSINADTSIEYSNTASIGSGITLWAEFSNNNVIGADSLGEKGKKAENVGKEAANRLVEEIKSKAAIDKCMADQILPYIALSGGIIKTSEITKHCLTNIYVIEKFLGNKFKIHEKERVIEVV